MLEEDSEHLVSLNLAAHEVSPVLEQTNRQRSTNALITLRI